MYCATEEDKGPMTLVSNTKIASLAILAIAVALTAAVFSVVFEAIPVSLFVTAEAVGLIPVKLKIPRIAWQLLFLQLELISYILPMFLAAWAAMILMLNIMTAMNCVTELRYAASSLEFDASLDFTVQAAKVRFCIFRGKQRFYALKKIAFFCGTST